MNRALILTGLALLVLAGGHSEARAQSLDKVKVVIPQNSVFVLNWMGRGTQAFSASTISTSISMRGRSPDFSRPCRPRNAWRRPTRESTRC